MFRGFLMKIICYLIILIICLPFITQAIEQFNITLAPMGYELGIDLSIGRFIRDPGGAIQEMIDSMMKPLTDFNYNF